MQRQIPGGGRKNCLEKETDSILNWIRLERSQSRLISYEILRTNINKTLNTDVDDIWIFRFLSTNGLSFRRLTTAHIQIYEIIKKAIEDYYYDITLFMILNPKINILVNVEETGLLYDTVTNYTIDFRETKRVAVKTSNSESMRFTVISAVTSNGLKIHPLIIFLNINQEKSNKKRKGKTQCPEFDNIFNQEWIQ